jgi:hypothetical protein
MTEAVIPFANLQESSYDEIGGASPQAFNVIVDGKGVMRRRPGMQASSLMTSEVIDAEGLSGIYMTKAGVIYAVGYGVGERPIYQITPGGFAAIGSGVPPHGLRGDARPTFAETEMLLVIAGGREPEKIELATHVSGRLGGSPPVSTHVIGLSNRLLLNDVQDDKTKVRYSDVALGTSTYAGHEVWSLGGVGTSGYFTAEVRPDDVVAIAENAGEAWVFGQTTLQTFTADEVSIFSPVAAVELGCGAPYSIVKDDEAFHWIDHKRRIVKSGGRGYEVESAGIQTTLDGMSTSADAFGYSVSLGFLDAFCWGFPTDGRTFVYQKEVGWGQWAGWANGNWAAFSAEAVFSSPIDGTVLVATSTGRVGEFSLSAATDFGDPIVARVTTGYDNRGTNAQKHCLRVRVALRRGEGTSGEAGFLRWRDRPGEWEGQIPIDFGSSGDTEIVLTYPSLGVYRFRQWQFEFSGTSQVSLVSVTEEFDVLGV